MTTIEHFEELLLAEMQNVAALEALVREQAATWAEQPEALRAVAQSYGRAVGRVAELGAIVQGLRRRAQREAEQDAERYQRAEAKHAAREGR